MDFLSRFLAELWHILVESGVWLLVGLLLAGVVHAFVPRAWFMRHLGGRGFGAVGKASLLGIPMPLCSCSVIPVAASLRRQGAGKGASAAFAISTPQTGEESIPLTWALFGPVFALARPVIAVMTGFIAGSAIDALDGDENLKSAAAPVKDRDEPTGSIRERLVIAWHHGFITMLRDLAPWLTVGLLMAALISAALPTGWIAENVGTGVWPKIAMLFVGVPLYICATSSTPLAWSLVAAGLSPGAAIVLLLAGPATNVATMSWVIKDLGVRSLIVYILTISAVALGAGVVFDAFFSDMITLATRGESHAHGGGAWGLAQSMGAGAISAGLLWAVSTRYWAKLSAPGAAASCCSTAAPTAASACCSSTAPDVALPVKGCCVSDPASDSCCVNDSA
ncbi:MAG: permease [Phycisphaerales bacterium]